MIRYLIFIIRYLLFSICSELKMMYLLYSLTGFCTPLCIRKNVPSVPFVVMGFCQKLALLKMPGMNKKFSCFTGFSATTFDGTFRCRKLHSVLC